MSTAAGDISLANGEGGRSQMEKLSAATRLAIEETRQRMEDLATERDKLNIRAREVEVEYGALQTQLDNLERVTEILSPESAKMARVIDQRGMQEAHHIKRF